MKYIILFIIKVGLLLTAGLLQSQTFTAKVIDEKTGAPISFATVQTGKYSGVVTNEKGVFTLKKSQVAQLKDSLFISSVGFETKSFLIKDITDGIIKLTSKSIKLKSVFLDTKNYSANEIIELVKKNMKGNYATNLSKKKIFFRQSDINTIRKLNIKSFKSTIKELDKKKIDSIIRVLPRKIKLSWETVGDFYGNYNQHKFYSNKKAELYDKNTATTMNGIIEHMERIFDKNVKSNSYLKLKSGWFFGTKVNLDTVVNSRRHERLKIGRTNNKIFQEQIKDTISNLYSELFFQKGSKLDFIRKSSRYKFEMNDYTFINDEPVYIIKFIPKGGRKFEGIAYINTEDFAVVRVDFNNTRPLRKLNLLGLNYLHKLFRGKMIFNKNLKGTYEPKYIELETEIDFGVDRPLKIIEKNKHVKGRRKQNELALDLNLQMNSYHKYQFVVYNSENITRGIYKNVIETSRSKTKYLPKYSPSFWSDLNIIDPNIVIESLKKQKYE